MLRPLTREKQESKLLTEAFNQCLMHGLLRCRVEATLLLRFREVLQARQCLLINRVVVMRGRQILILIRLTITKFHRLGSIQLLNVFRT